MKANIDLCPNLSSFKVDVSERVLMRVPLWVVSQTERSLKNLKFGQGPAQENTNIQFSGTGLK